MSLLREGMLMACSRADQGKMQPWQKSCWVESTASSLSVPLALKELQASPTHVNEKGPEG